MGISLSSWLSTPRSGEDGLSRRHFWLRVMLPGFLIFLAANGVAASHDSEITFYHLVVDPLEYADLPHYIGALSVFGCLLWMTAASLCLGTAALVTSAQKFPRSRLSYLVYLGGFLLVLLLDDTYQLHENFKSMVAFNGALQSLDKNWFEGSFFLAYAIAATWIVTKFRRVVRQTNLYILGCFVVLMALSTIADVLLDYSVPFCHQIEEGAKFLGIVAAVGYCLDLSCGSLRIWHGLKID
ncbi:MAG: hypothetical protein Fur0042_29760 [Cyanophyceae cyanobacterium]